MKHYELTYLISPDLSQEEANSLSMKINSLIQEKKAILGKTMSVLKKQLAYPIEKKTIAYLSSLNFQMEPKELKELKKQVKSESKILRYLILFKEKPQKKATAPVKRLKKIIKLKTKPVSKPKVELKEIEKKLEEILGET